METTFHPEPISIRAYMYSTNVVMSLEKSNKTYGIVPIDSQPDKFIFQPTFNSEHRGNILFYLLTKIVSQFTAYNGPAKRIYGLFLNAARYV